MGILVYYSSPSENTHRFVQKLPFKSIRLPIAAKQTLPVVDEPYVIVTPTYGGGHIDDDDVVPKPVTEFIMQNPSLIRGVIASGNTNFGEAFCLAGKVIARDFNVPFLYRFELFGMPEDVDKVTNGLLRFWETL